MQNIHFIDVHIHMTFYIELKLELVFLRSISNLGVSYKWTKVINVIRNTKNYAV